MVLPRGPGGEHRAGVPSGALSRPRKQTSADVGLRISDAGTDERGYCAYVFEFANVAWPFVGHQGVPEGCVSADDRGAVAERGRRRCIHDLRFDPNVNALSRALQCSLNGFLESHHEILQFCQLLSSREAHGLVIGFVAENAHCVEKLGRIGPLASQCERQ